MQIIHRVKEKIRKERAKKRYLKEKEPTSGSDDSYSIDCFDYHESIFIHIPKTAGISISKSIFGNLAGGHKNYQWYESYYPKETFNKYFKFTFVRNPYHRIFSAYTFLKAGGINDSDLLFSKKYLSNLQGFDDFILDWLNEENMSLSYHFKPQVDFLINKNGEIKMDFIGRMENLSDDFIELKKNLSFTRQLLVSNQSHSSFENYMKTCSSRIAIKERIYSLYAKDFITFNYQK